MPIQRWGHFLPLAVTIVSKRWIIVSFSWTLVSNVNTEEVEGISLDDLHGEVEVIRQLEIDMIVPFERDGLSQKLCLRPGAASCSTALPAPARRPSGGRWRTGCAVSSSSWTAPLSVEPSNSLLLEEKELESLAVRTEGMTGAGLRRIVADARNLYGYDVAKEQELSPPAAYFEKAIQQLEKHREQLASAPAYTAAHHPGASTKGLVKPAF